MQANAKPCLGLIGIGNPFASDDGVGIRAVREFRSRVMDSRIQVVESERGGMDILDLLSGLEWAVIVDAARTSLHPPGQIAVFTIQSPFSPARCPSLHTIDLSGLLAFGEAMEMPLPHAVRVVTVEAEDIETFGESCTPAVERSIPEVVETLYAEVRRAMPDARVVPPFCGAAIGKQRQDTARVE